MASKKSPNPIDIHVGSRVRLRRMMLGMSQEKLGEHLGITFQQIQKYECAANRMSAARLWQLAEVLEVPVSYFYEGLGQDTHIDREPEPPEPYQGKETKDLIQAFYSLSERPRQRLLDLAKSLNETEPDVVRHAYP